MGLGVSIGTPKLHSPSPKSPKDLAALAAAKEESPRILLEDFWDVCKSAKLTQGGQGGRSGRILNQVALDALLPKHALTCVRGETHEAEVGGMQLTFDAFFQGLITIAIETFRPVPCVTNATMKEAIEQVLDAEALMAARDPPLDALRLELRQSPECRNLVRELSRQLREIYSLWAKADERETRTDMLSCKEAQMMLQRAAIIGTRLSVVQARAFIMKTLFVDLPSEYRYTAEHDTMHLAYGDFIELLARAADEYFKSAKSLPHLVDRLRLVIEHVHRSVHEAGILPELKEPRRQLVRSQLRRAKVM